MSFMREAIKLGLESQLSLVVEIFLLFGNRIKRLLRTQNELLKGCTFSWYFFCRFIIFNHDRFFKKSVVNFAYFVYFEFLEPKGG